MRHWIRRFPRLWRASRLARRWYHARWGAYPDWQPILAQGGDRLQQAKTTAAGGPRVLIATSIGSYAHATTLESALAAALTLRGADVHVLLCDAALPACAECEASLYPNLNRFVSEGPSPDLCRDCLRPSEAVYEALGVTTHRYSDWVTPVERAEAKAVAATIPENEIPDYRLDDLALGEHARAGAIRFFASGSLTDQPHAEAVLRRYLEAALVTAHAARRLMRAHPFTSAVFTHGIYVPWGIVGEVARAEGVRVVNWNVAYRKRRFIFSHGDTYHHTLMSEATEAWEHEELTP
ncbi:MAG: capsule biosynthesis protein, partial [Acidobacteria bacterium]|nr:capsule biosynthesis protein [Acidobacteriota bacterium]